MSANIVRILESNARSKPNRTAIVHGAEEITYGELLRNVHIRAAFFKEKGIGHGDGVLIVVPMSIPLYEIMIALFHVGAVAVFVDAWADRKRLELARQAFPIKAFVGVGKAHLVRLTSSSIRSIPLKLREKLPTALQPEHAGEPAEVGPDDPALVTFTTGSTGAPKGANRTHGFLLAQHRALTEHMRPEADDIDMPTLPIFPLSNLANGTTTVLPDIDFRSPSEFDPEVVASAIERHTVRTATGSPAFFLRLAEWSAQSGKELSSLRRMFVGGAPVYPRMAQQLRDAFPGTEISVVYGSTEAEPISGLPATELAEADVYQKETGLPVGQPIDQIRLRLLDIDAGEMLPERSEGPGEICVTGDHVLRTYVGEPEAWKEKFVEFEGERWLRTGDAAVIDADGRLHLLGRVASSWMADGHRMFTLPVELMLQEIAEIDAGTIVRLEEETVVVVETKGDIDRLAEEINRMLTDRDVHFDKLVQLKKIPRDPRHASKIDYRRLLKEF